MLKNTLSKKIFVGLTGRIDKDWQDKIKEINSLKLESISFDSPQKRYDR
ncbi:MAG TPA: hypothetical protein PLH37_03125 [bacterium]|nr:hypothetical protein [bacterium]